MNYPQILSRFSRNLMLTIVLLALLSLIFVIYVRAEKRIDHAYRLRHISFLLADELRQSSDDLTRMARTYVVNGEPRHKQQYQDVLDIRNGKKPRPEKYSRIYWDLVLGDNHSHPRPNTLEYISLLDLMRQNGIAEQELAKLAEAKKNSDQLAVIEIEAMKLAEATGPDTKRIRARAMMHNLAYHQVKAAIMKPIDEFYALVDVRTQDAIDNAARIALVLRISLILFAIWLVFMLRSTYSALRDSLGSSLDEVYVQIARLGQGDFSSEITLSDKQKPSIMGWLAETQTKLRLLEQKQKKFEETLKESEDRFRALHDASFGGIIIYDQGRILDCNQGLSDMTGFSNEELVGMDALKLIAPDSLDLVQRNVKSGYEQAFEVEGVRKDGSVYPLAISGKKVLYKGREVQVIELRDITERKEAEEALRMSEERFRSAFETAAHGMALVSMDGRCLQVNSSLCDILGYRKEELLATNFQTITHADDLEKGRICLQQMLRGETDVCHFEQRYLHKQGHPVWVLLSTTPVRDLAGNPIYLVSQLQDITKRKQAEEDLQEANRELEAFVYTVSHDLRTPLTPIIGYAQIMKEMYREVLDEQALDFLSEIETQGARMLALMEDLLALAKVAHLEKPPEPVEANGVVQDVLKDLEDRLAEAGATVEQGPMPAIHVPESLLWQLFDNLIGNAARYAAGKNGFIEVGGERRVGRVRYFVRDHGPGIPEEERSRVFEVFYRGSAGNEVKGTGIGLATVQKIVRSYGGRAWVEETPGGGSTFWVEMVDVETAAENEEDTL